ncbi:MAG TPA: L-2-hydroxyglutarate oxidase [Chthoniobacterales bacterium]|jgi:L-2-hydroxyglutarate oxidase
MKVDCAVIGGGIIGLSVGMRLLRKQPGLRLIVLEKETELAFHQSGRNSGVIHSGIYYKPGTLKARFARRGNRSMVAFCREHGIPHQVCGKIIVAAEECELPLLEDLYQRGVANDLEVMKLSREEVLEFEPHVSCRAALRIPSTGIVNYRAVCDVFARLIRTDGGEIRTKADVREIRSSGEGYVLETPSGIVETKFLLNCGGLQSDRIARRTGLQPQARIMPFRGEYYQLIPEKRHLVKGLIYPTPDPAFPFLGVHFTRMIDGTVHAGPNAVLALRREGYRKSDVGLGASLEILTYSGCWKLARQHFRAGVKEVWRSISKRAFTSSLRRLIPEICETDLIPATPGVRAQALLPNGQLVDDFLIQHGPHSLHVCNAPSPAATASLEIGEAIAARVPELRMAAVVC